MNSWLRPPFPDPDDDPSVQVANAQERGITFNISLSEDLPMIHARRCQALPIILNVLANAIQHGPRGGAIHVTALFPNSTGVNIGTDVRVAGMKVGIVTSQTPSAPSTAARTADLYTLQAAAVFAAWSCCCGAPDCASRRRSR